MTPKDHQDRPGHEASDSELEAMMEQLGVERAPVSLRRRLKRIPREEKRRERQWSWQLPSWAMAPALAVIPLLAVGIVMMQDREPSAEEVEQARQDVALAFAYLDKAGTRTGSEIHDVLGTELQDTVTKNISKHIPYTEQSRKEETI